MKNLQELFDRLIKVNNKEDDFDCLKTIALAIWYENFIPETKHLKKQEAAEAGYILDRLTRYNCLNSEQKIIIRSKLKSLEKEIDNNHKILHTDKLAIFWGVERTLKQEFRNLLPYQRRSYHN